MMTTSHVLLNAAFLSRKGHPERVWPAVLGAVLPDIPMFVYFFMVLFMRDHFTVGTARSLDEFHLRATWVDWAHSIPLAAAGMFLFLRVKWKPGVIFFASMGLHGLEDLPFHTQYAHRHFLPFTSYRFISPYSYTEPQFHAAVIAPLEWLAVLVCCFILWRRGLKPWAQWLLLSVCIFHGLWLVYNYSGWRW